MLLLLVLVSVLPVFFGQSFVTLLALFAHDTLFCGPVGLSVLTSAVVISSVVDALVNGGISDLMRRGHVLLLVLAFGATLIVLVVNPVDALAPVILRLAGAAFKSYNEALTNLIQMLVNDEFRGRVMSKMPINRGLFPLGIAAAAAVSAFAGVRFANAAMDGTIVI